MNPALFESHLLSMFVRGACFTALVLVVGLLIYRRCSAHSCSLLWRGALLGLCLLPLLSIISPPIPILPARAEVVAPATEVVAVPFRVTELVAAESVAPDPVATPESTLAPAATSQLSWLAIIWITGVALVLSRWLAAVIRVRLLWRSGRSIDPADWGVEAGVRLRISERVYLPMTWGSRRPAILLPGDAEGWDAETRRTVLAHELAHARSGDSRFLVVAQLATAMHWANPLVWIVGRRLRDAQERVADDSVLATGQDAGDYAALLLAFAKRCTRPVPLAVSAMAHPSSVGRRIERVLDDGQSRDRLGAVAFCLSASVILATATVVAAAAPQEAAEAKAGIGKKVEPAPPTNDRGLANRAKLNSIIIPEINFTETKLEDAIAFLEAEMKQRDPEEKGVPIRIVGDVAQSPGINLQLTNVPVLPALQFSAELAGVDFIVKSTGVEIGVGVAKGLETRDFRVPRKLASKIEAAGGAEAYWSKFGAEFPDGSTIFEPAEKGGNMKAGHNPIANLKLMEEHIAAALKSGDTPTLTAIEEKLAAIILPQVEFDDATLEEAVDFLRRQSITQDPEKNPQARGMNLIIKNPQPGNAIDFPLINFSQKNVSLKAALEAVADQTGTQLYFARFGVVFQPAVEEE